VPKTFSAGRVTPCAPPLVFEGAAAVREIRVQPASLSLFDHPQRPPNGQNRFFLKFFAVFWPSDAVPGQFDAFPASSDDVPGCSAGSPARNDFGSDPDRTWRRPFGLRVGGTFLSAESSNWKAASTRRLENLRYDRKWMPIASNCAAISAWMGIPSARLCSRVCQPRSPGRVMARLGSV